ncbi:MAG TPA: response regulator [Allosphingosinicella sp.]|uniref:response regulator n=1 Tax=Allosphingosinicella sp. TaxID=2823234 RepID=UPI002EDB04D2
MTSRILYVDDEEDIREVASMSLELDPGLEVRTCSSGIEAIPAAAEWQPDLILLDVMMPNMDGPTTFSKLKAQAETADIPVVFITARTQAQEVEAFKALGAKGVIAKPFDPMSLAGKVREYLAQ